MNMNCLFPLPSDGFSLTNIPPQSLGPSQCLYSNNYNSKSLSGYRFCYNSDDVLYIFTASNATLWSSSNCPGQPPSFVGLQADGNFVMYCLAGTPCFSSGTNGQTAAYVVMQNDGNLVIYGSYLHNNPIWSTGTSVNITAINDNNYCKNLPTNLPTITPTNPTSIPSSFVPSAKPSRFPTSK